MSENNIQEQSPIQQPIEPEQQPYQELIQPAQQPIQPVQQTVQPPSKPKPQQKPNQSQVKPLSNILPAQPIPNSIEFGVIYHLKKELFHVK